MAEAHSHPVPPYGPAIQQAIAAGDLARMRAVADHTREWVAEHGDVRAALEALEAEIARREAAGP